jgi:hypothetical protein
MDMVCTGTTHPRYSSRNCLVPMRVLQQLSEQCPFRVGHNEECEMFISNISFSSHGDCNICFTSQSKSCKQNKLISCIYDIDQGQK